MDVIEIRDAETGTTARIVPDLGWNCMEFTVKTAGGAVAVLDPPPTLSALAERPSRYGVPLLFPFPNRIRQGRFEWNGRSYSVPVSDAFGNAIHGFCLKRPWQVVDQSADSVEGMFRFSEVYSNSGELWPADFQINVRYTIFGNGLRAEVAVHNPDRVPLPWGFGTHAYFRLPLGTDGTPSQCTVDVPARRYWELEHALPTGKILPVDEARDLRDGAYFDVLKLDDILTDIAMPEGFLETVIMDERSGRQLRQTASPEFRHVVAFTPADRAVICLEPYTCVTDAINLEPRGIDAGLKTLMPGDTSRLWWEFRLDPILV